MPHPIYLDYNGTTPHDPEVIEAMRPFLETRGFPAAYLPVDDVGRVRAEEMENAITPDTILFSLGKMTTEAEIGRAAGAVAAAAKKLRSA
jgi:cysteine sulfinate desulfinase/cysteine desulfurase-like protein